MKYSGIFLGVLVLFGISFAISLTCDSEITASGTYRPTADLTATAASNCVNISVSNLLIDCNVTGTLYSIDGTGAANAFFINQTGLSNITVRNCGIYNFTDYGFNDDTFGANNVTIIDSGFYSNGLGAKFTGNGTTVTDSSFIGSSGNALQIFGNNPDVTGSQFQHNGGGGILLRWSNNSELTDNYFYNNSAGLSLDDGNHSLISYNTFDGDRGNCVYLNLLDNTDVQRNNMTSCVFDAVEGYDLLNTEFSNNTILNTGLGGFFINITSYDWNVNVDFLDNTVNGSSNFTISSAIVLHNVTDSEVRYNIAASNNNTGFGFMGLDNVEITSNQIIYNHDSVLSQGYGVAIFDSTEILFEDNLVAHNGYDADGTGFGGILLDAVTNSNFTYNNISDNADTASGTGSPAYGIEAYDLENVTFDQNLIEANNGTGLYLSSTHGVNVTQNSFVTNGVGLLDYLSTALLIDGNIFNESTNLTAVGLTSTDAVFSNNRVHDNAASGVLIMDSGPVELADNLFYNHLSSYAALEVSNSSYINATHNNMHNNTIAIIALGSSDNFTASDNSIMNNTVGIWVMDSADALIDGNTLTDNQAWELYLYNSSMANVTNNMLYASSIVGVGIFTTTVSNSEFSGNTVSGQHLVGYAISDGSTLNTVTSDTVSGAIMGFLLDNSTNTTLAGTGSYGNLFGYEFDDYANATITDATSHDNTISCFDVSPGNVALDNFRMWGCGAYITSDENSSINATDLWLGYDNSHGLLYDTIYINVTTIADTDNLLLDRGFVSMNTSDAEVAALNVSATIYIRPSGGTCSALRFFNMSGFPQSQAAIIAGGTVFTPSSQDCAGGIAYFRVLSFSGYAVSGAAPPSGGAGTMAMSVSGDTTVGGEVTLTIMDGTTPVSGADVRVFYWRNGILQVEDLGNTNSLGQVTFTPAFEGSYKATADKVGYTEEEMRFIVSAAATAPECTSNSDCAVGRVCTAGRCVIESEEQPEQPEETPAGTQPSGCTTNADCAYNEACSSGACVEVQADACGEYVNHAWIGYNCCADGDCGVGYACMNNNCVQSGPTAAEIPGATSMPASTQPQGGETPWALVVVAIIIGAAVVWWLFVRKP